MNTIFKLLISAEQKNDNITKKDIEEKQKLHKELIDIVKNLNLNYTSSFEKTALGILAFNCINNLCHELLSAIYIDMASLDNINEFLKFEHNKNSTNIQNTSMENNNV